MKPTVENFEILGLFGGKDVKLSFTNKVQIYIGENGLGKTTVLNTLYYLLSLKFEELVNINFSEIKIRINEKNYSFTKTDLQGYVNRNRERNRKSGIYNHIDKLLDDNSILSLKKIVDGKSDTQFDKILKIKSYLEKTGLSINAPSSYIYDVIIDIITQRTENKSIPLFVEDIRKIDSKILYFPTYRRVEKDLQNLISAIKKEREDDDDMWHISMHEDEDSIISMSKLIHFGMTDVQKRIRVILNQITKISREKLDALSTDLLKKEIKGFPDNIKIKAEDISTIKTILSREQVGLDPEDKNFVLDLIESRKIYNRDNKQLLYLLSQLLNIYDSYSIYDRGIKNFVSVCNNYLHEKEFIYNEVDLKLELRQINDSNNKDIDLNVLSSGEKQIVSLFSIIFLEPQRDFIFLIDEPELSLSIFWQRNLIPDIIKSNKCDFLLAVTHSPFIFENEFEENTIGLSEFMSSSKLDNERKR